jgi:uncharacterized protein with PIN domain
MEAMNTAAFSFMGDLNIFLAPSLRGREVRLSFEVHQTVKHLVEALGVPHVEVGAFLADGVPVGPECRPQDGAWIEVQPPAAGCPVEPRFLLDNHLGRLAAYLRMLGFDCLYGNDFQDDGMVAMLANDPRILLSRDRRLLMRKVILHGYCPRSLDPQAQLGEVVRRFDLAGRIRPFHRCLRCNTPLVPVDKAQVLERLEPLTRRFFNEFRLCPECDQVYWKGSHYDRMEGLIEKIKS